MKHFLLFILVGCLYVHPLVAQTTTADTIRLTLSMDTITLDEVVVTERRTPAATGRWSDLHPVELVTVAGSNGDLYKALQTLPGVQVQGETGRLLVRGGSSEETQTYIDGLHVLKPYTSTGINTAARSRYSTFMFSGVNLASGGAPLEYGQALSAVLPLETKDESPVTKLGVNASIVGVGGGGTRAFRRGSLSVDLTYQHLGLYNKMYGGRREFAEPYNMFSAATQFRHSLGNNLLLKIYGQYDRTDFSSYEDGDTRRLFSLGEDNVYVNATLRRRMKDGWEGYAGAAFSYNRQGIRGAAQTDDCWEERQQELHVKATATRLWTSGLRVGGGVESFIRRYANRYAWREVESAGKVRPVVSAAFLSATWFPWEILKTEASLRAEYTGQDKRMSLSPRVAVNCYAGDAVLSATVGRYTQQAEFRLLALRPGLESSTCWQYNLGVQYERGGRLGKAETYYKDYGHLPLWEGASLTAHGHGHSAGFDLFFLDRASLKNVEYRLSYTYNLSRRRYLEYTELTTPQYATRHNASFVLRWSIPRLRLILGLTDTYASGRPWHNPALPGLMNDEAKPYNSLDLGLTFLLSPKVILTASATNILCRRNEFGRVDGRPVLASADHFFYVGVYVTLGRKAAYEVSNF